MNNTIDTTIIDNLITGRVEPTIYAFSTQTVPNYLKVGDTYRPVEVRLKEWRTYFPNLIKEYEAPAKIDSEAYFRDYAVHVFLENKRRRKRLTRDDFNGECYYSREFFKGATKKDLEDAIVDIKEGYRCNSPLYQYFRYDERPIPFRHAYNRIFDFDPRPNQAATISRFKEARKKGRSNLLMYAVMRFGKSFTSMCCAIEMKASFVVIVSAKADVREEWKKTVQSHKKFECYEFLDSDNLLEGENALSARLQTRKVVLFLTLQDLQGHAIKKKHKELFKRQFDLLIIDETHFGARAEEFGVALRDYDKAEYNAQKIEFSEAKEQHQKFDKEVKKLKANVRLHLSGTPYKILMGSEFKPEDIIAFYQFSDIVKDQQEWDNHNLESDEPSEEWENPYFGFPQMVRFAFNPNESSRKKINQLKQKGVSASLSALFKPMSIEKDINGLHRQFKNENEILELFKVIDGTQEDKNILSFLDYEKIKAGNMCRHIVCVLPYRASCDALEELINCKRADFKNLSEYTIINIAGLESNLTPEAVKSQICQNEEDGCKTMTLTVNKMLTGSTVEQWDTMLYFKDTSSPQEYDQAVYRLQNQYIKTYKSNDGSIVKYNMKPQTLLVDFSPNRMFYMQEQKSQIYNVNVDKSGNEKLEKRIAEELRISPIIVLNQNKIQQIEPRDILIAVAEYSRDKSVNDEAKDIPIDEDLLNNNKELYAEIQRQNPIDSKLGLQLNPVKGDGNDLEVDIKEGDEDSTNKPDSRNKSKSKADNSSKARKELLAKFSTYYARILFFSFLTKSKVASLTNIINVLEDNPDNVRVARNVGIYKPILEILLQMNPFKLSELDYKIQNINALANDDNIDVLERCTAAMRKFGRMSASEVVTPIAMAEKIVNSLPYEKFTEKNRILDLNSKQGEFAIALFKRFGNMIKDNIFSIPSSSIAYEFTRKIYEALKIPIGNIYEDFTSYSIIHDNNQDIVERLKKMKFNAIVGNPPYQIKDGGAQKSAKPIYHHFFNMARELKPKYISMIMPTRWYAGGKGLDDFRDSMLGDRSIRELHDYLDPSEIFTNTNIRGGICFVLWDQNYSNDKNQVVVTTYKSSDEYSSIKRALKLKDCDIFIRHAESISIVEKVTKFSEFNAFSNSVSSRKPFGLNGKFKDDKRFNLSKLGMSKPVLCYCKSQAIRYIEYDTIKVNSDWVNAYKVYTSRANNIGTELNDDNLNAFIGEPNSICTESYLLFGANLNLDANSAHNLVLYSKTRFMRFMHSLAKASHDATSKTYKFVPLQDFSSNSDINWHGDIDIQLYEKYKLTTEEIAFIESSIKPMK